MIQITLRPIDGSSSSEERIQRPERPQRANRPPGNTSPLQSFIIRAQTGQNVTGREELPRPNAPVQDENYNNRSISPLFANQSTPALNYHVIPFLPSPPSTETPCEMQHARSQMIDVEFSDAQAAAASSSNNPEFRVQSSPENNQDITREDHHDQQPQHRQRNNIWSNRSLAQEAGNSSVTGRMSNEHPIQADRNLPPLPRPIDRLPRRYPDTPMSNSVGIIRDNGQERSTSNTCGGPLMERGRRISRQEIRSVAGTSNARSFSPPFMSAHVLPRHRWEMWTGVGALPRRPLRRDVQPPLINLVEGEEEHENTPSAGITANNLPLMSEPETGWVRSLNSPPYPEDIAQNSERRATWPTEEGGVLSAVESINVLEDEEEEILQDNEEDNEDNDVLMSVSPEYNRDQQRSSTTHNVDATSAPVTSESTSVRQTGPADNESQASQPRNSDIRQLVLLALECPVCLDYVTPPIAQCYQGHLVCNKCRLRLTHCPECRGPFSAVRPRAVEKIASILEYPCSNEGCAQLVAPAYRIIHAKSCCYRSFVCPIAPTTCCWSGQKTALRNHILNFHGRHLHWIDNSRLTFYIQPRVGKEKVFLMNTMDQLFLVKFTVAPQDKLRGCVTLLGYDPSRLDSMNVMVLVQSADRPNQCLMVSRSPAEENDEMDMRLEKFAVFNISQLIQNSITPSPITVKVSIGKSDILRQLDRIFE